MPALDPGERELPRLWPKISPFCHPFSVVFFLSISPPLPPVSLLCRVLASARPGPSCPGFLRPLCTTPSQLAFFVLSQTFFPMQFMLAEQQKRQQRRNSPAPDADDAGGDFFASMGAVPVSGKNLYKLLQAGETALLFPGGVREAYKRKGEKYQLFWPARPEFVRMAIKFGATIVPFSAVGLEDSFDIVVDSKELLGAPVIGGMVRERISGLPTARPVGGGAAVRGSS